MMSDAPTVDLFCNQRYKEFTDQDVALVKGRIQTVLITGGAGSLGTRIVKRLLENTNCKVVVYSRDEGKHAALREKFSKYSSRLICVIGDVRDYDRLLETFRTHTPAYVIHAAAQKRIDDAEDNVFECYRTNVEGTKNVAEACRRSGAKGVLVSTDKACEPANVYGASKFTAERLFLSYQGTGQGTFCAVRYGNVIASRGSFIPIWLNRIKNNLPVSITHTDMTRFLFTLEDAVTFVLNALQLANGGEIFIPIMGAYRIEDVFTVLKEYNPSYNIEPVYTGIRAGEKMHESMIASTEVPNSVHKRRFGDFPLEYAIIRGNKYQDFGLNALVGEQQINMTEEVAINQYCSQREWYNREESVNELKQLLHRGLFEEGDE